MTNKTIIVSGDILSARIRENGFKKKEVAKATGISESRLCNICKPGNHRLMSSTLKNLQIVLDAKRKVFWLRKTFQHYRMMRMRYSRCFDN